MKQLQSLTDQMSLMIRSQYLGPPPKIESGKHSSRFGVFSVNNLVIYVSFVGMDKIVIKE